MLSSVYSPFFELMRQFICFLHFHISLLIFFLYDFSESLPRDYTLNFFTIRKSEMPHSWHFYWLIVNETECHQSAVCCLWLNGVVHTPVYSRFESEIVFGGSWHVMWSWQVLTTPLQKFMASDDRPRKTFDGQSSRG